MKIPFLEELGLTDKEALLYELLLQRGVTLVHDLISVSKLKRATVYKSLYSLQEKSLITLKDMQKKLHAIPQPPNQLLQLAEDKMKAHERMRSDIQTVLPFLVSEYILAVEKPIVTTFEGVDGLIKIYEDTLREKETVYAVLTTGDVHKDLLPYLLNTYWKKRKKLGIHVKVIASTEKWSQEYKKRDEKELRETVLVPKDKFPFQHEIDIYGTKVAFINYKQSGPLIGVIINHPQIAVTMKAMFDLAWMGSQDQKP